MKILFLDFDGVLNSGNSFHDNHQERLKAQAAGENPADIMRKHSHPLGHLSTPHLERLNRIIEQTGAKIVVSSVWRSNGIELLGGWMTQKGFKYRDSLIDITGNLGSSYGRGYEIQDWLNNHTDTTRFVILDDDWDMHHLMPYLIATSHMDGLEDSHVDLAIAMLNGEVEESTNHQKRSELASYMTREFWKHDN
jgi:hypothetical protein